MDPVDMPLDDVTAAMNALPYPDAEAVGGAEFGADAAAGAFGAPGAAPPGGRARGGPGTRVYVGNLSWEAQWQEVKDHMRGPNQDLVVTHADIMHDASGRSKGCAIVEYATPESAQAAIAALNDTDLMGRLIFVREDRESATTFRGGFRGGGGGPTRGGGPMRGRGGFNPNFQQQQQGQFQQQQFPNQGRGGFRGGRGGFNPQQRGGFQGQQRGGFQGQPGQHPGQQHQQHHQSL
ncbi:hypothetical protein T484DRAFT_1908890 [Baffinella frigidus]|nr:hypothetical protein T484DRAFT_1908890 [Cryptophyta sp. CCMP2293]